jgi:hypothetical protein
MKLKMTNVQEKADSLQTGAYRVKVRKMEVTTSKPETGSKLMLKTQLAVMEPGEYAGQTIFHYFVLGNGEDPQCKKSATLQETGTLLRRLIVRAGVAVPEEIEPEELCGVLEDAEVVATGRMTQSNPQYPPSFNVDSFYTVGEDDAPPLGPSDPTAGAAGKKRVSKEPDLDPDDVAGRPRAGKKGTAAKKQEEVEEEEVEEEETEDDPLIAGLPYSAAKLKKMDEEELEQLVKHLGGSTKKHGTVAKMVAFIADNQ